MAELRITEYTFGRITIGEKEFESDLIIHKDGQIQDNWWREQGHNLIPNDISTVIDNVPDKLVIGTGANGLMNVSEGVIALCENRGIDVEICRTAAAVVRFNDAAATGISVAGCFHLTC